MRKLLLKLAKKLFPEENSVCEKHKKDHVAIIGKHELCPECLKEFNFDWNKFLIKYYGAKG